MKPITPDYRDGRAIIGEILRLRSARVREICGSIDGIDSSSMSHPIGVISAICGSSIKDLTETIASVVGLEGEVRWDTSKPNGQPRRKLDVSRAREIFGFQSQMSFEAGLGKTIEESFHVIPALIRKCVETLSTD